MIRNVALNATETIIRLSFTKSVNVTFFGTFSYMENAPESFEDDKAFKVLFKIDNIIVSFLFTAKDE